jgi:glucose/arabinose dehydrogenase
MRVSFVRAAAVVLASVGSGCHKPPAREIPPAPTAPAIGSAGSAAHAPAITPPIANDPKLYQVPPGVVGSIGLEEIVRGLPRPVLITHPPHDTRLFVVLQRGKIVMLDKASSGPVPMVASDRPFFTIGGLSDGNEQGLLGLAFHPQFASNGRLYVDYTTEDKATHIVEYKVMAGDPNRVDPSTARELVRIEHPYSNHNGGNLMFGPDGKLYAGMGDGGSANDPHRNGQNPKALLAKIMRFDVDAANPQPEIVHIGVRNPWRFWFDAKSGDLYIGDVGQNLWENVYVVANDGARHNFGWNVVEGNHCFDADTGAGAASCDRTGFTAPVADYGHDQGCSVTGGVTYRGRALPVLDGRYFYADYCTGLLRSFMWTGTGIADHWDWKPALDKRGVLQQISSFGTDADGEVYIVELTGSIYKLVPVVPTPVIQDDVRCKDKPLAPGCS